MLFLSADDPPVKKINLVRVAVKSAGYLNEYAVMAAIEKKVRCMIINIL